MAASRQIHSRNNEVPARPKPAEGRGWVPVVRACGVTATFLAALVLASLVIDRVLPARELPPEVRAKVAYLAAHRNEYDTLFLGSSRVECHIIPSLFDRDLAGRGMVNKSFNVGIRGMFPPQDDYVLDQILSLKLPRLRWVFIEAQMLQTTVPANSPRTYEQIYWHDWPRFVLLCKRLVTTRPARHRMKRLHEALERWPDFWDHVCMFVQNTTNLGRGSVLLARGLAREPIPPLQWDSLADAGWISAGSKTYLRKKEFAELEKDLEECRRIPPVKRSIDPISQEALGVMIAKIEKVGATPVVLIPSHARESYFYPDPALAKHHIIFDFCDPHRYPEFYQTEYRLDAAHLNPAGAEIFTNLLAEEFADAVGQR